MPSSVSGASSVKLSTRNWGPNLGLVSRWPRTRSRAPTGIPAKLPTTVSSSALPSTFRRATVNSPLFAANTIRSSVPSTTSSCACGEDGRLLAGRRLA